MNLARFISPSSSGPDSNPNWRKNSGAGHSGRYFEIDLNVLNEGELQQTAEYLGQFGYWRERAASSVKEKIRFLSYNCHREMRSTLLSLLESPAIRSKLDNYFEAINALPPRLSEFIALSAYARMIGGAEIDAFTMGSIMGYDYYREIVSYRRTLDTELFSPGGEAQFRSPVFGEYYLREHIEDERTLELISEFVHALDRFSNREANYKPILRQALRYRFIKATMKSSLANELVDRFFEQLHNLKIAKSDPLFWIQASIAKLAIPNYLASENYTATARSFSRLLRNFDPYQIDTHEAKFLIESRLGGYQRDYGLALLKSANLVIGVISRREEDLVLPIEIVTTYPDYYARFKEEIPDHEVNSVRQRLVEIEARMNTYSDAVLARKRIGERGRDAIRRVMSLSDNYT
ncbi:hypothetical protein [Rhodopseudomonas sp. WA056]|uniref:hypothetical protein n=1 Tax=Rhodopseudomonas sp. WA056 TaxID=2269367 RepID=UPI0013DE7F25|nr:hypothetical protein [Rhodopseudomonas sp. WA056]